MSAGYGISWACPVIFEQDWEDRCREGWRWDRNLLIDDPHGWLIVSRLQRRHGRDRVAIGHAWDSWLGPCCVEGVIGIYVCKDIEAIVRTFMIELEYLL